MRDRPYNVLFLCTHNCARSIMAESILRKDGAENFRAFSAGSMPRGAVNAIALKVLDSFGYPTDTLASKSWEVFTAPTAPYLDFVFTVCDAAAGETCPLWPGRPITAHWGIEDPAAVNGSDIEKERAFVTAFGYLRKRISIFTSLPIASLGSPLLTARLRDIGHLQGATAKS
jgi:arsenate reductase